MSNSRANYSSIPDDLERDLHKRVPVYVKKTLAHKHFKP